MADQKRDVDYLQEWENLIRQEEATRSDNTLKQIEQRGETAAPLVERPQPGAGIQQAAREAITSADMLKVLAEQQGLEMADIKDYRVDVKVLSYLPGDTAREYKVFPLQIDEEGNVVVAIADPLNLQVLDSLRLLFDHPVKAVVCEENDILDYIDRYYGVGDTSIEQIVEDLETQQEQSDLNLGDMKEIDLSDLEELAHAAPVVKLANLLLIQAIKDRASDLHVEPFSGTMRIRYRVDGVLREIPSPPKSLHLGLVSRFKVMANMNISETRLPQDGRMRLTMQGREIDMRVASLPTVHGESIVMRLLDKSTMMIGIEQLGFTAEAMANFRKAISKPNGIVLCTGPTGCGKTTTLYAAMNEINSPDVKIITTEDPVEYEMPGLVQVNINPNVGLTFAACLRSILRQDPDIILVGEIRDVETARISIQASLTGHLVLSTLHTNDAASTLTRLVDMGIEPFLLTSTVECVVGQRLVRSICPNCRKSYVPTEEELLDFGVTRKDIHDIEFFKGAGCEECFFTGYKGRIGIFEVLMMTDEIRELVLNHASADEIRALAIHQGMQTMRQDGWFKICTGITTFEEVAKQTPKESREELEREMRNVLDKIDQLAEQKKAADEQFFKEQALEAQTQAATTPEPVAASQDQVLKELPHMGEAGIQAFKVGDADEAPGS
ncbi:MAG: ATPase, T2SS/T4P/T4SS family [Candidatus Sumerlaeia bacterium]